MYVHSLLLYYEVRMDYITVGEIVKAQGISGDVKVKTLTAEPERFHKLRVLYIDGKPYKVLRLRVEREFAYVKLQGVDDRTTAEALRGKFLQIDRINAVDLDEDEYFIADMIGCAVVTPEGRTLGTITDVSQYGGAADVITARKPNGAEFRFPFLNRITKEVDVAGKRFVVYEDKLDEVCVYDD